MGLSRGYRPSKISRDQFVGPFAASPINLRGGRVYQVAVRIEGAGNSCLIGPRLNSLQGIFIHVNDASIAPSCPQNRTARSVAS